MSLLLSIVTMAHAQKFKNVKRNADGSYNKNVVIETFKSYVDTVKLLPTTSDKNSDFVRSFFDNLPYSNDYGIVVKTGDEDSKEVSDKEWDEISQECIKLLEAKQAQVAKEKNEAEQKEKKPKLTYKKILLRIGLPILGVLIIAAVVFLLLRSKKKNQPSFPTDNYIPYNGPTNNGNNNGGNDLIIRRKTSSVLHKQSLDDVIDNGNYMALNCSEFCNDTAVKTMYIKNSCIMDIYNMYAEDLRNPNNPKEDGCMVLGRWIHDEKLDEYAVSLEEVVFPGDDAVFAEYELDFGGKIKVKVNEKLRKLRRDTNLQYDLTCWVHSHPGLGVFFSNTDCSLHIYLHVFIIMNDFHSASAENV